MLECKCRFVSSELQAKMRDIRWRFFLPSLVLGLLQWCFMAFPRLEDSHRSDLARRSAFISGCWRCNVALLGRRVSDAPSKGVFAFSVVLRHHV
jgi:hypothetical protein